MTTKYVVKYISNITNENFTSYKMTSTEAKQYVKRLKKQNALSRHNYKARGQKPFSPYWNIRIKSVEQ